MPATDAATVAYRKHHDRHHLRTPLCLLALLALTCLALKPSHAQQTIALTFDDLPETGDFARNTTRKQIGERITAALQAAHVPPVYGFINAGTLDDPDIVGVLEHWRAAGFLLGNHTFTHWNLDEKPLPVWERDITRNEPTLRRLMPDGDWRWFRYPYLAEGSTMAKRQAARAWLAQHGYRIAEVTIDFQDHAFNDPYARCVARHDQRSIDQLKTIYVDSANQAITVAQQRSQILFGRPIAHVMLLHFGGFEAIMLPRLLEILKSRSFTLIPLPQAEQDPIYAQDPAMLNPGATLLDDFMQARHPKQPASQAPTDRLDRICR